MKKIIASYCLLSPATGLFYIGSSGDLGFRIKRHLRYLSQGRHWNKALQDAWSLHGDVYLSSCVHYPTIEEARACEQLLLDIYLGQPLCVNRSHSAKGARPFGTVATEETKQLLSVKNTGEANPMAGRIHSDETRRKMREAWKPVIINEEYLAKVSRQVIIDGVVYPSVRGAARELGISPVTIRERIVSDRPNHAGYNFVSELKHS